MRWHDYARTPPWRRFALAVVVSGTLAAGCSTPFPSGGDDQWTEAVPGEDGIYADTGDGLVRLDGDVEWERQTWAERSDLPAGTELIIRDAALAGAPADSVGLRRVAWVRSTISDTGDITPVTGNNWVSAPLPGLEVPLDYSKATQSHPDLVRLRPQQALRPGLYAVYAETAEGSRNARFGVGWTDTDKQAYATSVCVDRYAGAEPAYRRCEAQTAAAADDGLQIFLVRPEKRETSAGRSMVISGVIFNNTGRPRAVPLLTAELRDPRGQALASWRFKADGSELEPGQSTSFRTEVGQPDHQVHSVNVHFVPSQASTQE